MLYYTHLHIETERPPGG